MSKTETLIIIAVCIPLFYLASVVGTYMGGVIETTTTIPNKMVDLYENQCKLQYNSWVKYTGNPRGLTFEEWKNLPKL